MRKFWSFYLILCFVVLLAPKSLYHSHEKQAAHHTENDVSITNADCFICDFDYSVLTAPIAGFVDLKLISDNTYYSFCPSSDLDYERDFVLVRGPPCNS